MLPLLIAAALAADAVPAVFSDALPPQAFRGDASFSLELRDQRGIEAICHSFFGPPPAGSEIGGCQTGRRIIAPNPCQFAETESYARLLCHELGHLNGWAATHPVQQADRPAAAGDARGALTRPEGAAAVSGRR